jgi:hypothetical protein
MPLIGLDGTRWKHLSQADRQVWAIFVGLVDLSGWDQEYDAVLGTDAVSPVGIDPEDRRLWVALRKKRVDVLLSRPGVKRIIEIKPTGGMAALGQLLTYRRLMQEETPRGIDLEGWLICLRCDDDVIETFPSFGLSVLELLNPSRPLQLQPAWTGFDGSGLR